MWKTFGAGLTATTALALGVGAPVLINEIQIAALPAHQRLVSDDILGIAYRDENVVEYVTLESEPATTLENEVPELRTEISQTYLLDNQFHVVFAERRLVLRHGNWYNMRRATTTPEAYDLQTWSFIPSAEAQTTEAFTSAGYGSWVAPPGVTAANVACWGGGGGGGDGSLAGGGGGGGGAFASSTVAVTPGTQYTLFIGAGGSGGLSNTAGGIGATSTFATTTVVAQGGRGGATASSANAATSAGGSAAFSTGTVRFSGGNGGGGTNSGDTSGGGAGGADDGQGGIDNSTRLGAGGGGGETEGGAGGIGKCLITYTASSGSEAPTPPAHTYIRNGSLYLRDASLYIRQ